MLKCLLETTPELEPHTYLFDQQRSKILAYRRSDTGEIQVFNQAFTFSKTKRKFKTVTDQELLNSCDK